MSIKKSLAIAGLLVFSSVSSDNAQPIRLAPKPSEVVARVISPPGGWHNASNSLSAPSAYKVWEPVLEELSGEKPVPSEKVRFFQGKSTWFCLVDADACYNPFNQSISIRTDYILEKARRGGFVPGCENRQLVLGRHPRLQVWVHEQGHHFDGKLFTPLFFTDSERFRNQLEAYAFEFYAGEHIARNYDLAVGLGMISQHLNIFFYDDSGVNKISAIDFLAGGKALRLDRPDTGNILTAAILLLHSDGLASFGEVWHYIHYSTRSEIISRIRRIATPEEFERALKKTEERVFRLAGAEYRLRRPPEKFDASFFERLDSRLVSASCNAFNTSDRNGVPYHFEAGFTLPQKSIRLRFGFAPSGFSAGVYDVDDGLLLAFGLYGGKSEISFYNLSGDHSYLLVNLDSGRAVSGIGTPVPGLDYCAKSEMAIGADVVSSARLAGSILEKMFKTIEETYPSSAKVIVEARKKLREGIRF